MKWYIKREKTNPKAINRIVNNPVIAQVLSKKEFRNKEEIDNYLHPEISTVYNTTMENLKEAAQFLCNNTNLIFGLVGDYDIDGCMSTYLLIQLMNLLKITYHVYLPDRIIDGYGLNKNIVNKALNDKCEVLLTCDNGIAAFDSISYAKEKGLYVIVTDHHELTTNDNGETILPNANILVNPKIGKYPFKYLCGAGVVFKLIIAVFKEKNWDLKKTIQYLPYTAFATIGDVVELLDENRAIVKYGLPMINKTKNIGLNALIKETKLDEKETLSVHDIGFVLGPCINAAGRLTKIDLALEMLLTTDKEKAVYLAKNLVELNKERQDLTNIALEKLKEIVKEQYMDDKILVLYDENIHESVAGIIAGKIKDEFYKPTIVLTKSSTDGIAKGSARSIEEYNIYKELTAVKYILKGFGGHSMAAGLSLNISDIDEFRTALNDNSTLNETDLTPKLKIDAAIPLKDVTLETADQLTALEPFGTSNPKPLFGVKNLIVKNIKPLGKTGEHFKLQCKDKNNDMDFILFFRAEEFMQELKNKYEEMDINNSFRGKGAIPIDLVYTISVNEYRGNRTAQTIIEDYRI
ncbi:MULTISPECIES: single-stranded-DNA-specific exonuclease RecJ [Clostridium]|jgi:single-stranded-DNA-specific exonuclease|uniref:single-stranded-DNA-specific exonuclease RecJ n=1 Tax=Clostridium TaxID=1485 RepID=UPI000E843C0E|nr:single-stranded-DNA-specific exonuclease RecJ [Clostridium tyrobutyricum]HBG38942.1 single-stranded-DNA-specific exonuclease RecJ [Clostridiaceae bacterium]